LPSYVIHVGPTVKLNSRGPILKGGRGERENGSGKDRRELGKGVKGKRRGGEIGEDGQGEEGQGRKKKRMGSSLQPVKVQPDWQQT